MATGRYSWRHKKLFTYSTEKLPQVFSYDVIKNSLHIQLIKWQPVIFMMSLKTLHTFNRKKQIGHFLWRHSKLFTYSAENNDHRSLSMTSWKNSSHIQLIKNDHLSYLMTSSKTYSHIQLKKRPPVIFYGDIKNFSHIRLKKRTPGSFFMTSYKNSSHIQLKKTATGRFLWWHKKLFTYSIEKRAPGFFMTS